MKSFIHFHSDGLVIANPSMPCAKKCEINRMNNLHISAHTLKKRLHCFDCSPWKSLDLSYIDVTNNQAVRLGQKKRVKNVLLRLIIYYSFAFPSLLLKTASRLIKLSLFEIYESQIVKLYYFFSLIPKVIIHKSFSEVTCINARHN